jgi:hypothetical protein
MLAAMWLVSASFGVLGPAAAPCSSVRCPPGYLEATGHLASRVTTPPAHSRAQGRKFRCRARAGEGPRREGAH